MKAFTYVNATTEKEAIAALQSAERGKMLPMAGGMDLLGLMKDYIVSPERVVSIKGLDQTIVAGTSWLPKVLVRPETVERLTPVALPALGTTGMRLTIANPVKAPVTDRTPVSGVVVPVPVSGGSTAVMERWEEQDTQDILITDEWRDMFRTETAHVCRSCLKYGRGVVGDDGRWICGRCYSSGTY